MKPMLTLVILTLLAIALGYFVALKTRRRGIAPAQRARIVRAWNAAKDQQDPVRRVLEADKVLDMALGACGFAGPLGDKLKDAGPRFGDLDAVWRAHKLRNRLAHEAHAEVSGKEADGALKAIRRGIEDITGRID